MTILNRDRESLSQQLEQVKAVLEASREREEAQSRELRSCAGSGTACAAGWRSWSPGRQPIPPSRSGRRGGAGGPLPGSERAE